MILLPRIEKSEVELAMAKLNEARPEAPMARQIVDELQVRPHWNLSGGAPATKEDRDSLTDELRSIAREYGYPKPPGLSSQRGFDRMACRILNKNVMLRATGGDKRREACWAGLTILDMIDLAVWRHGKPKSSETVISADRLLGGNRNFLRRLWLRNQALLLSEDHGERRWMLVDQLSEDAVVQIVERPSLVADNRLSQAIGMAWSTTNRKKVNMEAVMRRVTRRIRALAAVRMLSDLPDEELRSTVDEMFEEALHQTSE